MTISPYIQKLIRERIGCDLSRPSQFDALALDIEQRTGERIGVNTLKRLFGLLSEVKPTESTLQVIARYLGYGSWRLLCKCAEDNNSAINAESSALFPPDLPLGSIFSVSYEPQRHLVLRVIEGGLCRVEQVNGGKLMEGDMLDVPMVVADQPFIARRLFRQGNDIGSYTGGIEGGITGIHLNPITP